MDRFFKGIGSRLRGEREEAAAAVEDVKPEEDETPLSAVDEEINAGVDERMAAMTAETNGEATDNDAESTEEDAAEADDSGPGAEDQGDDEAPVFTVSPGGDDNSTIWIESGDAGDTISAGDGTREDTITLEDGSGSDIGDESDPVTGVDYPEPEPDQEPADDGENPGSYDAVRAVDIGDLNLGDRDLSHLARSNESQDAGETINPAVLSPEDLRVNPESASRADLSSYLSSDDDDDDEEVAQDYLIEKPVVELQRDPSLYPENPVPKAGEQLDVMAGNVTPQSGLLDAARTDMEDAEFGEMDGLWPRNIQANMGTGEYQSSGSAGGDVVEARLSDTTGPGETRLLGDELMATGEQPVSGESTGFTATDDLWAKGEPAQAAGFTATDDLWAKGAQGDGLKIETENPSLIGDDIGSLVVGPERSASGGGDAQLVGDEVVFRTPEFTATDDLWVKGAQVDGQDNPQLIGDDAGLLVKGEGNERETLDYTETQGQKGPQLAGEEKPAGLVEELGSDVFIYGQAEPVTEEPAGFTYEKIDWAVAGKEEMPQADASAGTSTESGWPLQPSGYDKLDATAAGKEGEETQVYEVTGTVTTDHDLDFTVQDDASPGKGGDLDGILTPIPEPDYSLGPAPAEPDVKPDLPGRDPIDGLEPTTLDPWDLIEEERAENAEWFEEQYQESVENRTDDDDDDIG